MRKKKTSRRPWGMFEEFCLNEPCTVKILTVNAGQAISLQRHSRRSEFWCIIEGKGSVLIGGKKMPASPGKEFFIAKKRAHQLRASARSGVKALEISFGHFSEKDEVRLKDKYGRK